MNIESFCLITERSLSSGAIFPVLGVVPAALKVALGVLQTAIATLFLLLSFPFSLCNHQAKEISTRAASHVAHGLANMAAGTFECFCSSLFIVGNVFLAGWRDETNQCGGSEDLQHDKVVGYKTLHQMTMQKRQPNIAYPSILKGNPLIRLLPQVYI